MDLPIPAHEIAPLAAALIVALVLLNLLFRLPVVGAALRFALSLGLLALLVLVAVERAPLSPYLAEFGRRFDLGGQQVIGRTVRIRMSPNGHFMADVSINGVARRMMIDSGATVTALSAATAAAAGVEADRLPLPVLIQTANGTIEARSGTIAELRLGSIAARRLKVVVSPAFGSMDVLGMNFLSGLASWRVEGGTLILEPHRPQAPRDARAPAAGLRSPSA